MWGWSFWFVKKQWALKRNDTTASISVEYSCANEARSFENWFDPNWKLYSGNEKKSSVGVITEWEQRDGTDGWK